MLWRRVEKVIMKGNLAQSLGAVSGESFFFLKNATCGCGTYALLGERGSVCVYACVGVGVGLCVHVCVCVYICVWVRVCVRESVF